MLCQSDKHGWFSTDQLGINWGPVVMVFANYHSELIWRLMRAYPYVADGLRMAGLTRGWL
ncbi:glucoamylase family protein [Mesorhizobium sp. NPDC059054]|uniref:glucoamylase family protein n=1 Tax=Mesorhizobium sp. NPDC059054 TaxID=3346711 RepID=UPI0036CE99FB